MKRVGGRLSKGLLRKAKKIANKNIALLHAIDIGRKPIGRIEPSAILLSGMNIMDLLMRTTTAARQLLKCFNDR